VVTVCAAVQDRDGAKHALLRMYLAVSPTGGMPAEV
jgi:hypothetical protein